MLPLTLPTPPRVIDEATLKRGREMLAGYESKLAEAALNLGRLRDEVSGKFAAESKAMPQEIEAAFDARESDLREYGFNLKKLVSEADALHDAMKSATE